MAHSSPSDSLLASSQILLTSSFDRLVGEIFYNIGRSARRVRALLQHFRRIHPRQHLPPDRSARPLPSRRHSSNQCPPSRSRPTARRLARPRRNPAEQHQKHGTSLEMDDRHASLRPPRNGRRPASVPQNSNTPAGSTGRSRHSHPHQTSHAQQPPRKCLTLGSPRSLRPSRTSRKHRSPDSSERTP